MSTNYDGYVYSFYPCGYVPSRNDNTAVWVRHKTSKEQETSVPKVTCAATETGAYVDAPDREIYIDRAAHVSDNDRPLRNWDSCTSMSMLYHLGDDFPNDRLMINHTSFSARENELAIRAEWLTDIQTKKTIICDSGGFQLRSGKEFWIDPEKLAVFYNDNVDQGVTLDIPIPTFDRELLTRMLRVQKNNSKFLLKHISSDVQLANVAHGTDYDDFMFVRERLYEDPRMQILCIPSSVIIPDIKSIDRLCYHLTHGQEYKQYHLLGVYNMTWLSLAIKLIYEYNKANNKDILLTSDASSSIYSASALRYHKQVMPYKSVTRWPIGNMAPVIGKYNLPGKTLMCQCAACDAVKYMDAFAILGDINVACLLTRHNEIETINWTRLMCEAAATMDLKDYLKFCLEQSNNKYRRSILEGFAYLEMFLQDGWEKTHARFKHKIATLYAARVDETVLFDTSHDGVMANENVGALNQHLSDVLRRYERFYKTGKRPKVPRKTAGGSFFHMMGASASALQNK